MRKEYRQLLIGVGIGFLVLLGIFIWIRTSSNGAGLFNPLGEEELANPEKPYDKYSFERLAVREDIPSEIEIGRELVGGAGYQSLVFYYRSEGRRISGQVNIPVRCTTAVLCPVVVMARGYVDKTVYETGMGTKNGASVYAQNGYITLAPDFSGYGESDQEDENALGARVVKPVEILDLLASLNSVAMADLEQVYLWGHSNGGQIMLSVAEILGKREPSLRGESSKVKGVTLWAPVSKPFPYSILYYTDEASDHGKWLRRQIAEFEQEYDVYDYSIDRYWDWIALPIQVHQGGEDDAVPKRWNDELVESLKSRDKDVTYYAYPGADHNMRPNWSSVVTRDLEFFASN